MSWSPGASRAPPLTSSWRNPGRQGGVGVRAARLQNVILTRASAVLRGGADVGALVDQVADFVTEGATSLSVNLPHVALPPHARLPTVCSICPAMCPGSWPRSTNSVLAAPAASTGRLSCWPRAVISVYLADRYRHRLPRRGRRAAAGDGPDRAAAGAVLDAGAGRLKLGLRSAVGPEHVLLDRDLRASSRTGRAVSPASRAP